MFDDILHPTSFSIHHRIHYPPSPINHNCTYEPLTSGSASNNQYPCNIQHPIFHPPSFIHYPPSSIDSSTCESLALTCSDIGRQLSELAHIPGTRTEQIHPLGHTNLRHSDAIKATERQKKSKYDELAAEQSAVFVPFIATTFGGLSKEALKFIDMLSAYARHSSAAASHKTIMDDFKFGIAVKIQQGNYKIIDTAWRYHTRHRGNDE